MRPRSYAAYEKKLKEAGAFDFDDLIYQTVILLSEHEDVREFYQNKYKYLLVDEYQDTSVAQFRLVSLLTGPGKEHLRRGRRRPEHLPLPRRDH